MRKYTRTLAIALLAAIVAPPCAVYADVINPRIRDTGKVYSTDTPDTSFYGNGMGGRAAEASDLRFAIERDLQDGKTEAAIVKAKRAVQFDPSDPETHLLLARALTKKFYSKKGEPDEKLLTECLYEWTLLWHHDSDQWEQLEAKRETKRMLRIAKAIAKQKREEQIARIRAKEELAKERREEASKVASRPAAADDDSRNTASRRASSEGTGSARSSVPSTGAPRTVAPKTQTASKLEAVPSTSADDDKSVDEDESVTAEKADAGKTGTADGAQLANKKKRFGLF